MEKINIKVYAKVNLNLDINGVFEDGYHSLNMLMSSCDLYDEISAEKSDNNIVYMDGVLQGENNTAQKAIDLLKMTYGYSLKIDIKKHIPLKAGLGGSSADAAGVFYCYSKLYGIDIDDMKKLALSVGADVVYMINGGSAQVKGRGELVFKRDFISLNLVIVQKEYGGETSQVYKKYDSLNSIKKNSIHLMKNIELFNVLQEAAISICPSIQDSINDMSKYTKNVFMSGSGSAVIGVFDTEKEAYNCLDKLDGYIFKSISKTIPYGIEEV